MTLKELRKEYGLTQLQASQLVGVSLRSYKQYENEETKQNTFKYRYLIAELEKKCQIDEEHGILSLDKITKIVKDICIKNKVEFCYLFGSYAKGQATEKSDVDLLVATSLSGIDFYALAEQLRQSLHKKVDLLNIEQLSNNLNLVSEILKGGIRIYVKE